MSNTSSAYITVKDYNQTYHFTGVLSVTHALSLKVFEKADATELGSFVNGAKNQPDKVTLSVLETDAAHSAAGWATRMLDVLESVKRNRLLCRVVTPHHTYDDMLLTCISVTQSEEHPDALGRGYYVYGIYPNGHPGGNEDRRQRLHADEHRFHGSGEEGFRRGREGGLWAAPAASAGAFITGFLSLQNGSSLEQKMARAGISTDSIRYIV